MRNPKLSFLIAAHNEEKIIAKALQHLIKLPYDNYEVILGLDGCTDNTEKIVKQFEKKSKKIRHYNLNLRQGKPVVIDTIAKKSTGDIIIIHDADWIFAVKNKENFQKLIDALSDLKVGGIAESFPIQYPLRKGAGFLEAGVMMQNSLWIDYIKKKGKKVNKDWVEASKNAPPLLVNILRKKLYHPNITLADDFERFYDIIRAGKIVLATNNPNIPRMVTIGERYTFSGIIKQKERTALARKQLKGRKMQAPGISSGLILFILNRMPKMSFKELTGFCLVNLAFIIGTLKSKFHRQISTREGWRMRLKR